MKKNIQKIILSLLVLGITLSCSHDGPSLVDRPDSVVILEAPNAPPLFLEESWNGHEGKLFRYFLDDNVAVYYPETVTEDISWPYLFASNVWSQVRSSFTGFNDDILHVVLHKDDVNSFAVNKYNNEAGVHIIDLTLASEEDNTSDRDAIIKEISKIVETSAFGIDRSPASIIWMDQWEKFFLYNTYIDLGLEEDAQRVLDANLNVASNFPVENTFWIRDWFYPLYQEYGEAVVLNNFFRSLSQHFFIIEGAYERDLTFGEFVHFWSGAAGEDIQPIAEEAFGWNDDFQQQLIQARTDFPNVNYPFEPTSEIVDVTTGAVVSVNYERPEGQNSQFGSINIADNDYSSKYWIQEYHKDLYIQLELPQAELVDRYQLTSGNDVPPRDPKSWTFMGSNDGQNWVELDKQEGIMWDRSETKEFLIDNETAYKYYRLQVFENNGGGWFQVTELRLLRFQLIN